MLVAGKVKATAVLCFSTVSEWRYLPPALVFMVILVSLPARHTGLLNDDFIHRALLMKPSPATDRLIEVGLVPKGSDRLLPALQQTYVAVHPDQNLEDFRAYGALPWWTYEGFRVAFWRPLGALTLWLDYRLFPKSLEMMHLHSILWLAAVMFSVTILYRRITEFRISDGGLRMEPGDANPPAASRHPQWIAGLAGLMYLLDDSSYFPTMWLANRNILLSLLFGILTLIVYDRWHREEWRPGVAVAPLCLVCSLLSAEGGVATFAYLFAYEAALGQGRLRRRGLALLPSVAAIVLWRLCYSRQGYGASGGAFYLDPGREPLAFAAAVVQRAPFFLGGQWINVSPDLYSFLPSFYQALAWGILAVLTVLIPIILLPLVRVNRRARFWLIGMYGSVVPFCATIPMSRALLFVAVGAYGIMAEFIAARSARPRDSELNLQPRIRNSHAAIRNWISGGLLVLLFVAHVPWAAFWRVEAPHTTAILEAKMAETLNLGPADALEDQDLIVVNAPNPISFLYDPYRRACEGRPVPRAVRMLAPGFNTVKVTRTSERRLVVRSASDSLLDCQRGGRADFVFFYRYLGDVRSPRFPMHVGDRISLPRMEVQVLAVDPAGSPVEAAFEFCTALEDASLKWLKWDWDKDVYEPFQLPTVGQTVTLPGPF
ncbi:MAG: hypothetical protein A2Y77_07000 [Planctomycetes bacterium RBG_13_62_9]|nr:MAG: hypothetical protein A2Y77_07000 [Planctomycetes bacterium RBG_13_62_9]